MFSDLHVGVESDSKLRIDETKQCMKWIVKTFKKENVDWVIFCGDFFNSRYSINVNTLNAGIEMIQDLAYNFEKVILIEGNHDTYYKNTNSVNSVTFMKSLSKNDNIVVVDEKPFFIKIGETTMGMYPWGYDVNSVKEIEGYETPRFGFGHFEFNGAELVGHVSVGNKYNLHDMFILGDTLFSGHYHGNKTYRDIQLDKFLYMIGSPLQLNWGDFGQEKMIITLDLSTESFKEFKNEVNARHEKVFYSKFINKEYDRETLQNLCTKNFVKFVIDAQYKFDLILKCSEIIKKLKPHSLEFDYLISSTISEANDFNDESGNIKSKTNKDYLIEYIESVFPEYKKVNADLDLDYLKDLANSYFDKALLPKEEREDHELEED